MAIEPRRASFLFTKLDFDPSWLESALDGAVDSGTVEWVTPIDYVRGSQLPNLCTRSQVIHAMGHRGTKIPVRRRRIFKVGDYIEEGIVAEMEKAKILVSRNEQNEEPKARWEVDGHLIAAGHYDQEIVNPQTGEHFISETKSIGQQYFEQLPPPSTDGAQNVVALARAGYEHYLIQWMFYSWRMGYPRGYIIFEAKNTQDRLYYLLAVDPEFLSDCLARAQETAGYIHEQVVPASDRKISKDPVCKWCDHHTICRLMGKKDRSYEEVYAIGGRQ